MTTIDGGRESGSGTLVRFAVAFAALVGEPVQIVNARARRDQPGLRPQHATAVRACAELCGAEIEGVTVGSRTLTFRPRMRPRGGTYAWDIGTAGSATMLALGILPVACLAEGPVTARITGGVFQGFAPSPYHLAHVLAPIVARMGADVALEVLRPGYVPRGAGVVELRVRPCDGLRPVDLREQGTPGAICGLALASHLAERRVAERMASACEERLHAADLACAIERRDDCTALHAGAGLGVWTATSTGCVLGADRAGARGRTSEAIGRFVAERLLEDLGTGATTDRHLADQLVVFTALAEGISRFCVPVATDHVASNLWLAGTFGARTRRDDRMIEIEGLALRR